MKKLSANRKLHKMLKLNKVTNIQNLRCETNKHSCLRTAYICAHMTAQLSYTTQHRALPMSSLLASVILRCSDDDPIGGQGTQDCIIDSQSEICELTI